MSNVDINVVFTTDLGVIKIVLFPDKAPNTVALFLSIVRNGYYNNSLIHRVNAGTMFVSSVYDQTLVVRQPGVSVIDESNNGLLNTTGTIAMLSRVEVGSDMSSFHFNMWNNDYLDDASKSLKGCGYCVFGKVISGMDVLLEMQSVPTVKNPMFDHPVRNIVLISVNVEGEAITNFQPPTPAKSVPDQPVIEPVQDQTPVDPPAQDSAPVDPQAQDNSNTN